MMKIVPLITCEISFCQYVCKLVCTRKLVATEEDQERLNFLEDSASTRKLVASGNSETEGSDKVWPHNLHMSTNYVVHMEKVFSIVRQRYGLTDQMKDLDVFTAIWCIFMSVTLQAAVYLGKDYTDRFAIYQESTQEIFLRQCGDRRLC